MQVVGGQAPHREARLIARAWLWRVAAMLDWRISWWPVAHTRPEPQPAVYAAPQLRLAVPTARDAASGDALPEPIGGATFDAFYARHEQPLYGYLRRLLPSHEVAVELAQETFFRAWRHFDTLRAYDRPEAWLYRVATNLAISHQRRKAPLSFSALLGRVRLNTPDHEDATPADLFPDALDLEGRAAERDLIDSILRALPERPRAALLLAAVQGFTSDEIAEALDITPENARQILSRARQRFRRLYDESEKAQRRTP